MSSKRDITIPMIAVLLVAAVAPGFAGATATGGGLAVGVAQDADGVTVTVTQNGTAVENASVTVEAANATYTGEGTHATDASGAVSLPTPAENVTVTVTAAKGNRTAATTADLVGYEDDGTLTVAVGQSSDSVMVSVTDGGYAVENATVTVSALNNGSYAGEGEYVTDANGTVALWAPEENVTVEVTATKGNATGSTTAELVAVEIEKPEEFDSFGQRVSWFVHSLLGDDGREGGIGDAVSEFVTNNNPGSDNKPDHAGKPAKSGHQGNKTSGGGPPEHANNDKGNDKSDE